MRNALVFVPIVLLGLGLHSRAQNRPAGSLNSGDAIPAAVQADLRSLMEQYFAAYQKKDLEAVMALWSTQSPSLASVRQETQAFFAANENIRVTKIIVSEAVFDEPTKVRVRVSSEASATDVNTRVTTTGLGHAVHVFDLLKESDKWKIWQDTDAAVKLAAALVAMTSEQERAALLKKEKESIGPGLIKALMEFGTNSTNSGEFGKASEVLSLAGKLAEEIGDEAGRSAVYGNTGYVCALQGDYRQAKNWVQKSLDIAQRLQDRRLIASSLVTLGVAQARLGENSSAMESYQKSLEMAESIHERLLAARALANLGVLVQFQGDFAQAEKYDQRALALFEELGSPARVAGLQVQLGQLAIFQNNYSFAMEYFQKALPLLAKKDMWLAFNSIGTVLGLQGEYSAALDYFRRSLEVSEKLGAKGTLCWTLLDLGGTEIKEGNLTAALRDLAKGLEIAENVGDKAASVYLEGFIGEAYVARRNYKTALPWQKKSLALATELDDELAMGNALENLSVIYRNLGEFDEAIESAKRAVSIGYKIGNRKMVADAAGDASKAYRGQGQVNRARKTLQEAIDTVESMRLDVAGGEQQRQRFLEQEIAPYQEMADLLISQNEWSQAFALAERVRGRVLFDVISSGKVRPTKAMTEAERHTEDQIEAELVSLNGQVRQAERAAKPEEQLASLKAKLDQARTRYEEFQINLYAAHPELKTERGQVSPITLEQTAELLRDSRSVLLEFSLGEKQSYLFVITRKNAGAVPQLQVYPLRASARNLGEKAEQFRRMLAARAPEFQTLSRQLYHLLLEPAQRQLAGKNMLVVVPDGALWNLPFQALVQNDGRYVVQQYAVAYAPSLTVLREMTKARNALEPAQEMAPTPRLLAMADPALGKQTLDHASFAYRGEKLAPLPDARREVQALKQFYPGAQSEIYVGAEAREDRFKAEAGKFRILHLASHAVLDNASPMYSNILLSPGDSGREDGLLEGREIMQMDLHASLVVLSACETARGHVAPGEGVIGLTWAFFLAGTPTMVVSQWRVESASTATLMSSFHRFLNSAGTGDVAEVSVARALQKAEIQILRRPGYAHPFYWAGFVVTGDPGVVASR